MDKKKEILNKDKIMTIYLYIYVFLVVFLCRDSLISTTILGFTKTFL